MHTDPDPEDVPRVIVRIRNTLFHIKRSDEMYSMVLMMAMAPTPDASAFGRAKGGCTGNSCHGAMVVSNSCYGSSCHGGRGGLFHGRGGNSCNGGGMFGHHKSGNSCCGGGGGGLFHGNRNSCHGGGGGLFHGRSGGCHGGGCYGSVAVSTADCCGGTMVAPAAPAAPAKTMPAPAPVPEKK
jgi:hypothetical protein